MRMLGPLLGLSVVVIIACTTEPDLSRLPGTYVSGDGEHVLVLRDDRTGQLRIDGHAPGTLGAPCDPPDTCNEGVCRAAFSSDARFHAENVCQCALGADKRPLIPGCTAEAFALKPLPLVVETDALGRIQLELDTADPQAGDYVCWSCRLDDSGARFECDHAHPQPGERLPKTCVFERVGPGGVPPSLDGGRSLPGDGAATRDGSARSASCQEAVCPSGTSCCWSNDAGYCSTPRGCEAGDVALSCTTARDCAAGEECCAVLDSSGRPRSAVCTARGCSVTTLCTTDEDCGANSCVPLDGGGWLRGCL